MKHPDSRIQALLDKLASPALATIDLSLDRIRGLLDSLGNPQDRLPPVVHVAGTNGKGSLLAYLAATARAAGLRAHRYISPHLVRFNERILLAGEEISDAQLLPLLERVAGLIDRHPVTFFEATTAAAFLAFAETPADILLLETGLGGRLDATNVVRSPLVTAITPLSMDHMDYLGDTIAAIAEEKAGIIKPGVPCVIASQPPEAEEVLVQAAKAARAPLYRFGAEWEVTKEDAGFHYRSLSLNMHFPKPNLAGEHQIINAGMAAACAEHMKGVSITKWDLAWGITHAEWPARLQRLTSGTLVRLLPPEAELWLDGGHNPGAGEVLARWAAVQTKPLHLICGMLKTKDTVKFLTPLAPYVASLTPVAIEGESLSQPEESIKAAAKAAGIKEIRDHSLGNDIKNALKCIVNDEENSYTILICGSLYLAGNILWQNSQTP